MKKVLTLIVLIVTAGMAWGQGTVSFQNQTGLVKQWTSWSDSTLISVPKSGGYVQLIAASLGTPLNNPLFTAGGGDFLAVNYSSLAGFLAANPGWAAAIHGAGAVPALIGLGNGLFSGGIYTIPSTVLGVGANASYLVLGWTGSYATIDAAIAAAMYGSPPFLGESAIFTTQTTDPAGTGTPGNLWLSYAGQTLASVMIPEPSTFALAGLGAAALILARRRR